MMRSLRQQRSTTSSNIMLSGRQSSSAPPPVPEFQVRVQGPDGKSEAVMPIWVPLSIMASSATRTANQPEPVSQTVADAVIGHGNSLAQKRLRAISGTSSFRVDVLGQISIASQKASQALVNAGGSRHAANAVEEAIKGGGKLLIPSLNSRETIRLNQSGSESRNDAETMERRRGSALDDNQERGVHEVATCDGTYDGGASAMLSKAGSKVTWADWETNWQGDNVLSGKEIVLGSGHGKPKPQSKLKRNKLQQWKKSESNSRPSAPPQHTESSSTSGVFEYEGRCCVELSAGLADLDAGLAQLGQSTSSEFETFQPINLLPLWEAESVAAATYGTIRQAATMAPLMNLFLPVPKEKAGGISNRFAKATGVERGDDGATWAYTTATSYTETCDNPTLAHDEKSRKSKASMKSSVFGDTTLAADDIETVAQGYELVTDEKETTNPLEPFFFMKPNRDAHNDESITKAPSPATAFTDEQTIKGDHTVSTRTVMSKHNGQFCVDFRCPADVFCDDVDEVKDEYTYASVYTSKSNDDDSGIELSISDPLPDEDFEPQKKKTSTFKKMKSAFEKLNCRSKKNKGSLGEKCDDSIWTGATTATPQKYNDWFWGGD